MSNRLAPPAAAAAPAPQADWRDLLAKAIADHPRGRTGVAEILGISRTAVSTLHSGKYPSPHTGKMAELIRTRLGRRHCPYLDIDVPHEVCAEWSLSPMPTSAPYALEHWRTCTTCPHRVQLAQSTQEIPA